ncbi:hypothetical protein AB0N99_30685 [Streptomyces sp. NPDC093272]|uniref:hypothetical protein n=1 Tax=Streptomyces sp. NPDC093272 TaxID=3154981 RepID=UPI00343626FB
MAAWDPTEMAALELFHQLANLSPDDSDRSLIVSLRLPNGRHVGDVALSAADVTALSDAARVKRMADDGQVAWPVPEDEISGIGDEAEQYLLRGGEL